MSRHCGARGVVSESHAFIIGMKVYVELMHFKCPYFQHNSEEG